MAFRRASSPSKLGGGFGLLLALTLCLCYGSARSDVESTFVVKGLRGLHTAEASKVGRYNPWMHGHSRKLSSVQTRILQENCTNDEFQSVKSGLIDTLYETEKDIRKLRRIVFGSMTCRFKLKKAIKRIHKVVGFSSNNDFGRAWRRMNHVIVEVESCSAALNSNGQGVGHNQLQKVAASLNRSSSLILESRSCYRTMVPEDSLPNYPPPKFSPQMIVVPTSRLDAGNGSESLLSPDSYSKILNESYGDNYFNASIPALSPDSNSNSFNESYGDDYFNASIPALSPDSNSNSFNESYGDDYFNASIPALSPDSNSNSFNESYGDDYFNASIPALSPSPLSNLFNESYGDDFFNGSVPSPSPKSSI